jgi:N-acetylmuramoyl-L-alanine amidase
MNICLKTTTFTSVKCYRTLLIVAGFMVAACSSTGNLAKIPSENYNGRVSIIVIHHTSANFEISVNILTKKSSRPVSSHYLVPDPSDKSYTNKKLEVYELVPETERAWHAGKSYWAGKSALNDHSIGIEVVNQTYCEKYETDNQGAQQNMTPPPRLCFYPDFPESQIDILIDLLHGIQERHPRVDPVNIIGHSDIAPDRKIDPGPRFPWERLYQVGIGAWFDDATVTTYWKRFAAEPLPIINVQKALHVYGYKIEETGQLDEQTHNVLRAFQMHFRPSQVSGEPTLETTAILFALIDKYRPRALEELLTVSTQTVEASP